MKHMNKCYSAILILIISVLLHSSTFAQDNLKTLNENTFKIEAPYIEFSEFTDPAFPVFIKTDNPNLDKEYLNKLEEYAKLHPPCPMIRNTGNDEIDKAQFQDGLNKWIQKYTFFPKYIPYHLFNRLLSADDDIVIYQNAVNAWISKNSDKYQEINNQKK